jgi:hypothetical protein
MGWTVGGSNPGEGEVLCLCPKRPWCAPSHLHNGHRVSFPGIKRPGRDVDHQPPSSAEVKERAQLYLDLPLPLLLSFAATSKGRFTYNMPFPFRSPATTLPFSDANSHIPCCSLPRLCRGLESSLSERHIRGMAGERHGMCESNTAALCKSSGKDTI